MSLNDELSMPSEIPQSPDTVVPPDELSKELTMPHTPESFMLNVNLQSADINGTTPERAKQVLDLQKKTGLPINMVDSQLELVAQEAAKKDFNVQKFTQDHPAIAKWMAENPQQASLGRDDKTNLSNLDVMLRRFSPMTAASISLLSRLDNSKPGDDSWLDVGAKSMKQAGYGFLSSHGGLEQYAAILKNSGATPVTTWQAFDYAKSKGALPEGADLREVQRSLYEPGYRPDLKNIIQLSTMELNRHQDEKIRSSELFKEGTSKVEFAQQGIQENAPKVQDPGLKYYFGQGTQAFFGSVLPLMGASIATGGVLPGLMVMGTQVYGQKLGEQLQDGRSIGEAQGDAWFYAAAETIPEQIPLSHALKEGMPFFNKLLGTMWREGAQEMVTEVMEAGYDSGVLNQDMTLGQAFRRVADAGIVGALMGGGMGTIGYFSDIPTQIINNRRNKEIAQNNEKFFTSLGDTAKDSKLRQALPEKYQELVGRLTKDGPLETLYTPVEFFQQHFEEAGMDPRQVANDLGIGPQYDQALESGTKLAIPTAAYATKIAPTEHNAAFVKELTTSPDNLTARELDDLHEELKQSVKQDTEEQTTVFNQSLENVREDVFSQLSAVVSQSEAKNQSVLWMERIRARAEILGQDPLELYQKHRLTIGREMGVVSRGTIPEITLHQAEINASGESSASLEAIHRQTNEKLRGQKRYALNVKTGQVRPLIGPDAVDVRAQANEAIIQYGVGKEPWTILDHDQKIPKTQVQAAINRYASQKLSEKLLPDITKNLEVLAETEVSVQALDAETGKLITLQENANDAIKNADDRLIKMKELLDCLG